MSAKPLRPGGEVDSWCTKCRLVLNHRIVALDGGKPHNVECLTCRTVHRFRPNAPGTKAAASSSGASSTRTSSAESRATRTSATAARAEQARLDHEKTWEKAIAGRSPSDFKPYSVAASFDEGDLINHGKFGEGVVQRVLDSRKIEVAFRGETRTLAQNLVD